MFVFKVNPLYKCKTIILHSQVFCKVFILHFILYICPMKVEEFLKTEKTINLAQIAFKMYPNNKSANTYLINKLNGNDNRKFTKKDSEKALSVLKEICADIRKLTP